MRRIALVFYHAAALFTARAEIADRLNSPRNQVALPTEERGRRSSLRRRELTTVVKQPIESHDPVSLSCLMSVLSYLYLIDTCYVYLLAITKNPLLCANQTWHRPGNVKIRRR